MTVSWFLIRGSGIAAFGLLSIATIWGLLVSTKVLGLAVKAKGLTWFHESLGLAAVLATSIHLIALSLDEYVEFGPREILVPGASGWRPLAIAFGITAFYGMVVVSFSFYVKQWIGQAWWRTIHFLSFGAFVSALAHGIAAGTDTSHPLLFGTYAVVTAVVVLLLVIRVAQMKASPSPRARSDRPAREAPRAESGAAVSAGPREG